jgi:hypothetical protein
MLEAHGPQGAPGRVRSRSPPYREAGSKATGYVMALEPTLAERRVLGPLDMWQPRIPPRLRGWIRCHETRGGA